MPNDNNISALTSTLSGLLATLTLALTSSLDLTLEFISKSAALSTSSSLSFILEPDNGFIQKKSSSTASVSTSMSTSISKPKKKKKENKRHEKQPTELWPPFPTTGVIIDAIKATYKTKAKSIEKLPINKCIKYYNTQLGERGWLKPIISDLYPFLVFFFY